MFNFLNKYSIAKKMTLIFISSVLIPVVFQYFLFYSKTANDIESEIENRLEATIENKVSNIRGNFSGIMTLARKYNQNTEVSQSFNRKYESDKDYYNQYNELKRMIVADVPYHLQIKRITFMTNNPTIFNGGYVAMIRDGNVMYENESYISDYKDEEKDVQYLISTVDNRYSNVVEKNVSFIKELNAFSKYTGYMKVLRVDLNLQYFSGLLDEVGLFERIMVLDDENRILFISSEDTYKEGFSIFDSKSLGDNYRLYYKEIEGIPFRLCGVYNKETIISQFAGYRLSNFIITVASVLFAAVFIMIIANNILRRMNKVVHLSEQIAEGNFIQLEELAHGADEFSELEKSMNMMSERLEELIDNEYKAKLLQMKLEKETVKAKYNALQSQVNPHFLFNALESIRLKALVNEKKETSKMIKIMAKMFRNLINWNDDIISVGDEVTFLQDFLKIQKYRFEDEFSYEINVEEAVLEEKIPKMMIQPLVENACIHGSNTEGYLHVTIEIRWEASHLTIRVADNGAGIPIAQLNKIRWNLENEIYSDHVGIYNVYQRQKFFCKEAYDFKIMSEVGEGTVCEVILPSTYNN